MDCKSCKDCLHYELCIYNTFQEAHYFGKDKEIYITIDNNSPCKYFADCSEWVHLPCKAGDTLYEITSRNTISEYEVTAIQIELFNVFIDWKLTQGFVDRYISDMPVGEIGKTVFLTREEAEKALEEKK